MPEIKLGDADVFEALGLDPSSPAKRSTESKQNAAQEFSTTQTCRYCANEMPIDAWVCPKCNRSKPSVVAAQRKPWSRGLAVFLSVLIPGLGQLYRGRYLRGLLWFVFTPIVALVAFLMFAAAGPVAFLIGLLPFLLCWADAARGDVYERG